MSRKWHRYTLKRGNEIVYFGITKDPERREEEHRDDGKRFGHMKIEGPSVTKNTAEEWEENKLESYKHNHGDVPKYNETEK